LVLLVREGEEVFMLLWGARKAQGHALLGQRVANLSERKKEKANVN
jgi:hypothetical protein